MAMNSTQLRGVTLDKNKKYIIKKYKKGIDISILASEFDVGVDTICRRLRTWGEKVRKGDYHKKIKNVKHWRRKFSKEFIINRMAITKKNNVNIKFVKTVNNTSDTRLIKNILKTIRTKKKEY